MAFRIAPVGNRRQRCPIRFSKRISLADDWLLCRATPSQARKLASLRVSLLRCGTLQFDRLNNRVGEFRGAGDAADIPGEFAAVSVDLVDGVADLQGGIVLAQMAQHEQSGAQ